MEADLAWQVRAWGRRVLAGARAELGSFYPTFADFQAPAANRRSFEPRPRKLCPLGAGRGGGCGGRLQEEFDAEYLDDPRNPRWVPKPAVAYLWARSVACKGCRRTVPLLKTRWLCRKDHKRVLLEIEPADRGQNGGIWFTVRGSVPVRGGRPGRRRRGTRNWAPGTMTRAGATCPACSALHTMADLRAIGRAGRLGRVATAVVVDGPDGKGVPPARARGARRRRAGRGGARADRRGDHLRAAGGAHAQGGGGRKPGLQRGRLRAGHVGQAVHAAAAAGAGHLRQAHPRRHRRGQGPLGEDWGEAVGALLACGVDRFAEASSTLCIWESGSEFTKGTFSRFALPMTWDFRGEQLRRRHWGVVPWRNQLGSRSLSSTLLPPRTNVLRPRPVSNQPSMTKRTDSTSS